MDGARPVRFLGWAYPPACPVDGRSPSVGIPWTGPIQGILLERPTLGTYALEGPTFKHTMSGWAEEPTAWACPIGCANPSICPVHGRSPSCGDSLDGPHPRHRNGWPSKAMPWIGPIARTCLVDGLGPSNAMPWMGPIRRTCLEEWAWPIQRVSLR